MLSRRQLFTGGSVLGILLWASPGVYVAADPADKDPELQALLDDAGNFTPDPGEPREAIKAYLITQRDVLKAFRRIEIGRLPNEADFDPDASLTQALIVRREATAKYPTSRHAWEGLGDVLWWKYKAKHKSNDLREAVDAYERASEIAMSLFDFAPPKSHSIIGAIAAGRAALVDPVLLDTFFRKVKAKGGNWWEMGGDHYAMALGKLHDARAEPLWRDLLTHAGPDVTSYAFVEYLWDRKRYQDALDVFDRVSPISPAQHAQRGALLERLGRVTDAQAEYKVYVDEANTAPFGRMLSMPDRYRIPGSKLQHGIKFKPDTTALPGPTSRRTRWLARLAPSAAWAGHVPDGCPSSDWFCRAHYYISRTIAGEAGCINALGCLGTVGGQRAVAWNIRTRVFYGLLYKECPNREYCANYGYPYTVGSPTDYMTFAIRYYFVIDSGSYQGLTNPYMRQDWINEAVQTTYDVSYYGRVPDPIVGGCLAGYPTGETCSAQCTGTAGHWGSFFASQSGPEFRGGMVVWSGGQNTSCTTQKLVPIATQPDSYMRCGTKCYSLIGVICPKQGTLYRTLSCGGSSTFTGPISGNFYWRLIGKP